VGLPVFVPLCGTTPRQARSQDKKEEYQSKMINKIRKSIKKLTNEYKQVKWPTPKQAINLTIFVLILSAIITLIILGLDALFHTFISRII